MVRQSSSAEAPPDVSPREFRSSRIAFGAALLGGVGFILTVAGRWLTWNWIRSAPYAMIIGVAVLLVVGLTPIYRAIVTEFWHWFNAASARNERRTQRGPVDPGDRPKPPAA